MTRYTPETWPEDARFTPKVNPLVASAYCRLWDLANPRTRFVFCATTGRSGTEALTELFTRTAGCAAEHEPYPRMNGGVLRDANDGRPESAERAYRARKAPNVRRGARGEDCYVETNHLFVKSFWRYAHRDLGSRLRVIHLRRHPIAVARSITRIGAGPGTEVGNTWYLDHEGSGHRLARLTPLLRAGGTLDHPFHRALWYWYEVEARVHEMRQEAPDIPIHTLSWSDRLDPDALAAMVRWLDLPVDPAVIADVTGRRINTKRAEKTHAVPDADALERMHTVFRSQMHEAGYDPADSTPEGHPDW